MTQPNTLGNSAKKIFNKGSMISGSVKNKNEIYKVNKKHAQCINPVSLSRMPLIKLFCHKLFFKPFYKVIPHIFTFLNYFWA